MPAPAGHSAWFSDDRGETFVHPNSHSGMYLEARVWSLASHRATPERLFAGTDMGVFRWDEPTARWAHLPSPMQDVWAIAVDPADPDALIAGTRPGRLLALDRCRADLVAADRARHHPGLRRQRRPDPRHADSVRSGRRRHGLGRGRDRQHLSQHRIAAPPGSTRSKGLVSGDVHGHRSREAAGRRQGGARDHQSRPAPQRGQRRDLGAAGAALALALYARGGAARRQLRRRVPHQRQRPARQRRLPAALARLRPDLAGRAGCRARSRARSGASPTNAGRSDADLRAAPTSANCSARPTAARPGRACRIVFGELRALHWRALPAGTRRAAHVGDAAGAQGRADSDGWPHERRSVARR